MPIEVRKNLDLDHLKLDPTSYVDPKLKDHQTDVLFSVPLANKEPAFVYILVEHKSYNDKRVTFQLLKYMLRIWESCPSEGQLPLILPLVLYHGPEAWNGSHDFGQLFDVPEGLGAYTVDFKVQLIDLGVEGDDKIKGSATYMADLCLMKHFFSERLPDQLKVILGHLKSLNARPELLECLEAIVRYLGVQKYVDDDNLREVIVEVFEGEETVVTMLTKAEAKGEARGKAEGLAEGEARGLVKSKTSDLLKVLNKRFGAGDHEARIEGASLEQLELWFDRALDADRLDDVFQT